MWFSMTDKSFPVMENKKTLIESDFVFVLVLYPHPFSRQLQQQQQQAELEGGGTRDGMYEAGPITLSQVSPQCLPLLFVAMFLERLNVSQKFQQTESLFIFISSLYTKQSSMTMQVNSVVHLFSIIILLVPRCLATQQLQPGLTTIKAWRSQSSTRHCTRGLTRSRFFRPHLLPRRRFTLRSTTSPLVAPMMCTGIKWNSCSCLWRAGELFKNY